MPQVEVASLIQRAVLWPVQGYDEYGQFVVSDAPCEIKIRWVENRSNTLDKDGNAVGVDATADVDRRIEIGSILWLGKLKDWPVNTKPQNAINPYKLMEVKTYNESPDLKGRNFKRGVGMIRYRDTLPTYAP
jgi:hypothetical protein